MTLLVPPPPTLASLPYGTRLAAGLGQSTVIADLDFETYSEAGHAWDEQAQKWRPLPNAAKRGLPTVGAAFYAKHPTAELLTLCYDLKDGRGRRRWHPGCPDPVDLFAHVLAGQLLEAWNVSFERWIWEEVCVRRMGWPPVQAHQWRCAMAKARSWCMPGALAAAGKVLKLATLKDADGGRLLDRFSQPRNPTQADPRVRAPLLWSEADVAAQQALLVAAGVRPNPAAKLLAQDLADSAALLNYNEIDIASEAEASAAVPDLDETELGYWQDDQAINHRGVAVDLPGIASCIALIEQAHQRYNAEFALLTGIDAASKLQQLLGWLHARGVHMDSLDEEAIEGALKRDLPPEARRALEIRAAVGSASVKKVFAMRNMVSPAGRLHDLYLWSGARTGRPTGSGPQPTNLPKAGPPVVECGACKHHHRPDAAACPWCGFPCPPGRKAIEWNPRAAEDALAVLHSRSLALVEHVMGDAMAAVAGVLRGLFVAREGCDLVSSDFSAIEGVVIAALAGEQWRLDVFAGHGKIYEMSAAKILGLDFEEMLAHRKRTGQHHPARQNPGKIAELGLGFGGWINAWKQFNGPGTDEEIKANILAWRDASPAIVYLWGGQRLRWDLHQKRCKARGENPLASGWTREQIRWGRDEYFGLEGMAAQALLNPGQWFEVTRLDGAPTGIAYIKWGDALYCRLRSGRHIAYHRPKLEPSEQSWRGLSLSFEGWNSNPKNGPLGWIRMNTYAGRLAENVVQATARDIQMHAIHQLEQRGYPIVLHTYDEVVAEVPKGFGSVEELEAIMAALPDWAAGWPIKAAGGWRGPRYCKA
jgi:DNA polymerase bacteriophage-type